MARIVLGSVVATISGSVAGCTYSRNRYGPYVRNRSIPVNPSSGPQVAVRQVFADLATAWNVDLDDAERAAWNLYALNTFTANGMTGFNAFVAANAARRGFGARIDDAPGIFNLTELSPISIGTMVPATNAVPIVFNNADEWANNDDGYLFLSWGRPVNESVLFFKGPFQRGAVSSTITGDAVTPPTSPFAGFTVFPFVVGQRVYVRAIASMGDGRLSVPQIISKVVV